MLDVYLFGLVAGGVITVICGILAVLEIEPIDLDDWGHVFFVIAVSVTVTALWPLVVISAVPGVIVWGFVWGFKEYVKGAVGA